MKASLTNKPSFVLNSSFHGDGTSCLSLLPEIDQCFVEGRKIKGAKN